MTTPDQRQKLLKIINKFRDLDAAIEINEMLFELERTTPEEFWIIHGRLLALVKHGKDLEDLE